MADKTITLSNKFLNAVLRATGFTGTASVFLRLNTTASTSSSPGTEVADANYARQSFTVGAMSAGVSTGATVGNSGNFFGAGAATGASIVEVAIYDAVTGGNELFFTSITTVVVGAGDTTSLTASNLTVHETGKPNTLSASLTNALLQAGTYTTPVTVFAALNTTASTATTPGTEITGDSNYARQAITFAAASGGSESSNASVTFFSAGAISSHTVVEVALYDAVTGGNELYFGSISSHTIGIGDKATIASGNFTASET